MKSKANSTMGRIPPELVVRAKNEGLSTTAYTKKLLSEYDLLKGVVSSLGTRKDVGNKKKKNYKGGFFGGLEI